MVAASDGLCVLGFGLRERARALPGVCFRKGGEPNWSNSSDVRCSRTDLDRPGTHPHVRSVETQTVDTPIEESDLLGTDRTLWCKRTEEGSGTLPVAFDDGFSSSALRNSCYP